MNEMMERCVCSSPVSLHVYIYKSVFRHYYVFLSACIVCIARISASLLCMWIFSLVAYIGYVAFSSVNSRVLGLGLGLVKSGK